MFSGSFSPSRWMALDERRGDVQVQRVAELVALGGAAGLDAGGEIARVVASEAGFAQRAQQVAQRLEAEKVQALVGDLELACVCGLPDLAARSRAGCDGIVRLVDGDVVFLLPCARSSLLDQLRRACRRCCICSSCSLHLLVEQVAVHQRLLRWPGAVGRASARPAFRKTAYGFWKPLCSRKSESALSRSSMLISRAGSATYLV